MEAYMQNWTPTEILNCCCASHEQHTPGVCKQEPRPESDTSSQWILCGLTLCWLNSDNAPAYGFLRMQSWIGEVVHVHSKLCWEQHLYFTCHEGREGLVWQRLIIAVWEALLQLPASWPNLRLQNTERPVTHCWVFCLYFDNGFKCNGLSCVSHSK